MAQVMIINYLLIRFIEIEIRKEYLPISLNGLSIRDEAIENKS